MIGGTKPAAFICAGGGSCGSLSANICSMFRRVVGVRVGVVRVGAPALLPPPPLSRPSFTESRDILTRVRARVTGTASSMITRYNSNALKT